MPIHDADWVRHLYDYNAETGEFLWRNPPRKASRNRAKVGGNAGTVDQRSGSLMLNLGGKRQQAARLAWLYVKGEWPDRQVHFVDANLPLPERNKFTNLRLVGTERETTAERIREVLNYNPVTGEFVWKIKQRGVKAGMRAGTVKKIGDKKNKYIRVLGVEQSAGRLAWLFHYGDWPESRLEFKNGDASDTRIENILESRFSHGTRQDDPLTQEEREERRKASNRRHDTARYGLSEDSRVAMEIEQDYCCAACGKRETGMLRGRVRRLAVDHCHQTGKVRQLLCVRCNASQGVLNDNLAHHLMVSIYRTRHASAADLDEAFGYAEALLSIMNERRGQLIADANAPALPDNVVPLIRKESK
jgi:hypothetical protein